MSGGHSSGSGGGTSSGRSQFRSQIGCCICGTKSSSSRFTISARYSEHFAGCFGQAAGNRSGDLCNACVLCVKRWLQRDRKAGLFSQVLDSKKGPGPKHMKEITKRARRREARKADAIRAANSKTESTVNQNTSSSSNQTSTHRGVSHSGPSFATRSNSNATAVNGQLSGTVGYASRGSTPATDTPNRHGSVCNLNNTCIHLSTESRLNTDQGVRVNGRSHCQWTGRTGTLPAYERPTLPCCSQHQRMYFSPKSTGATFTRAAAAAIRKCEASINKSASNPFSCSTPFRGGICPVCTGSRGTPTTSSTPSETSDYGSLFNLSCCSSSCSRCPTHNDRSSSCCSSSSCGGASSGFGCGMCHSPPPCCAFCTSDATPSKQVKYDGAVDEDRGCLCRGCPCIGHQSLCHAASHMDCCLSRPEFRYPHPPPGNSTNVLSRNGSMEESSRSTTNCNDPKTNNVPSTASSLTPTTSAAPTRRYNRRVVLPPVRMTHNEEVNSLLREIMERNSQAITFDSREMHMAVQKELRLRSRTVQGNSTSDSVSGRASSISSADGSADARTTSSNQASGVCSANSAIPGHGEQSACEYHTKRHCVHHCCSQYHTHCCHGVHLRHLSSTCPSDAHHRKT